MSTLTRRTLLAASAAALILPMPAFAEGTVEIEMLNKHPEDKKRRMVFYPLIQVVQPGTTVKFVASSKGHNSASMDGMIPEGVEPWKGKINQEVEVTFDKPGFYGYKCTPHVNLGMVGLIIVEGEGKMDNYEAAKAVKHRSKAAKIWDEIWAQVEADGLAA